ncbi:MAG: helix-turn-helix transcriptional regulator [Pedobacter sp.]|uniref:helix-turn-helix domain-containing protein n=1 Tax=Pedobacter sp. TaxID=1411316 RepID=UPI0028075DC5|nr:helix-turn-helix transcriptional regulator [Pedobacter sp.]MDQ8004235.1 helix-turn-helix transcriptional regulator [Pedobacter sp.]
MANQKLISEIGANIKQLRLAKAKGQTEVANALNISVAALSKIENGQTDINLSRLAQIAKYFEVSISAIISKEAPTSISQDIVEEISELKQQLSNKDAEVMKLQKKVIDLYDKLGL